MRSTTFSLESRRCTRSLHTRADWTVILISNYSPTERERGRNSGAVKCFYCPCPEDQNPITALSLLRTRRKLPAEWQMSSSTRNASLNTHLKLQHRVKEADGTKTHHRQTYETYFLNKWSWCYCAWFIGEHQHNVFIICH